MLCCETSKASIALDCIGQLCKRTTCAYSFKPRVESTAGLQRRYNEGARHDARHYFSSWATTPNKMRKPFAMSDNFAYSLSAW